MKYTVFTNTLLSKLNKVSKTKILRLVLLIIFSFSIGQVSAQTVENKESKSIKTVKIEVKGMSCQKGCADGLDAKFGGTEGIISSTTTFSTSLAEIKYDETKISEKDIVKIIKKRGFKTTVLNDEIKDTGEKSN